MAFYDTIEKLKKELTDYSAEEGRLTELYQSALENARSRYTAARADLDAKYRDDRNDAVADRAREDRNTAQLIASRGLGFSGEAAQSRLNGNIALSNRLSELARQNSADRLELDLSLADTETELGTDHADKLSELLKRRNELTLEIAKAELTKEEGDADRQAELDRYMQELAAEKERLELELKAERDNLQAKLDAESRENAADRESDRLITQMELKAKLDMLNRELASENSYGGGNGSSGDGGGDNGGDSGDADENEGEGEFGYYIPDINARELAKQLLSSTTDGEKAFSTAEHTYLVNRYLLDLIDSYGISEEYYADLVFALKTYGYTEHSYFDMKTNVIGWEGDKYFDKLYKETLNSLISAGIPEGEARSESRSRTRLYVMNYIYSRADGQDMFKKACKLAGIPDSDIDAYIKDRMKAESTVGYSGTSNLSNIKKFSYSIN